MNRYPLWRYILIVLLIILGVIYALPNLPAYGDDYAVQVLSKGDHALTADVGQKIKAAMQQQKIPFISIAKNPQSYLIRFHTSEQQAQAQDIIQVKLGSGYTVALNLAPKTPKWLQAIGATPMKLGLDLRGGIHFLLAVDVNDMLKQRAQSDLHSMGDQLRQAQIRYTGISALGGSQGILIRFSNQNSRDQALAELSKDFTEYSYVEKQQGIGYTLQAVMQPAQIMQLKQYAVQQNLNILRTRVNALGVAEPRITQQGVDKISVDLPGIQDMARAKDLIGKVASLQMRLVDSEHDAQAAQASGVVPFGSTLFMSDGRPILIKNQVILSGSSITNATSTIDQNGRPAVSITASGPGVAFFNKMTSENVGKLMAVVYYEKQPYKVMQNGKVVTKFRQISRVISVANINEALGNSFIIMGLDSPGYARNLALLLRSGAYTAQMSFAQTNVVGPSLGAQNIKMGALACEIGSLAVFIFMLFYYRFFGLIADLALVFNVIFLIALMSLLNFTLTLPGIAAIILTVGMAVDANVLIYERIREELRNGMSPQASIKAGYGRAFTTIVDANITTLIVALILFALGTGPVQGFAISLILGLSISMVTSIFFTRAVVNLVYGGRNISWLMIGIKKGVK
ncbi:MAG: protein translocase subunit SecD [Gammaproteobacteria bacterium]|nr:protein translocase subunit SecD [Gammaproteobacteria bacterium]MCH9744164.1 protein translocase subunit SecD [Gammaproteobacteria bacterium]